jgi:transglutaminase-like putative cysteine protease
MITDRRALLKGGVAMAATTTLPMGLQALAAQPNVIPEATRSFQPMPGAWRTFEITTRVELADPVGPTRIWLPMPSIESEWQRSVDHAWSTQGQARLVTDGIEGTRILLAQFADGQAPVVELTSRVQTRNRAMPGAAPGQDALDVATRRHYTRATELLPTDGIVRHTARQIVQGVQGDAAQARAIYDWVVSHAWRDPAVRGCGEGDIKTMLQTGNLGGKCADINALFVGLCRSVGLPARDVYGIRLAPSAFGYKELSGNPAQLKGAQHCRAEVFLSGKGWVAMDPADVAKVMRLETAQWIKTTDHPVVAPVYRHLFGGWEGNWLGWNYAHDLHLPSAKEGTLHFLMYPVAETDEGRVDSYAPDSFKYSISARELS